MSNHTRNQDCNADINTVENEMTTVSINPPTPEMRESAYIAILKAISSNTWQSDDVEPDKDGVLPDLRLDLSTCKECHGISRDTLDYVLRHDINLEMLVQIADRPIAIDSHSKGCILF